jgi:hypothetical protein
MREGGSAGEGCTACAVRCRRHMRPCHQGFGVSCFGFRSRVECRKRRGLYGWAPRAGNRGVETQQGGRGWCNIRRRSPGAVPWPKDVSAWAVMSVSGWAVAWLPATPVTAPKATTSRICKSICMGVSYAPPTIISSSCLCLGLPPARHVPPPMGQGATSRACACKVLGVRRSCMRGPLP